MKENNPRPLGLLRGKWNLPDPEELERIFMERDIEFEKDFYGDAFEAMEREVRKVHAARKRGESSE